jgi:two-component system alkaline phosphatase synthesis response regulator PhoP
MGMADKIGVIEDDELIRDMVRFRLEKNGYIVRGFPTAESFMKNRQAEVYDLLILDIVLPGMQGVEMLTQIRHLGDITPALILTVKNEIPARLGAFRSGADDFMVKPFNLDELLARVRAIIRRGQGQRLLRSSEVLVIGRFKVTLSTGVSESNQGEIRLSDKETSLLLFFARHPGQTLSRADILEEVWGMHVAPTPRTIDNFILRFRKLYEDDPEKPKHFLSVRGHGYRFEPNSPLP